MHRLGILTLLALWTFLAVASSSATAQQAGVAGARGNQQPQQKKATPKRLHLVGKIHSYTAEQINVVSTKNEPWVIKLNKKSTVTVNGNGTPDMLRRGVAVRFYAKVTKRGVAVEPVDEITVFTPREGYMPMVEAAEEEKGEADEKKEDDSESDETKTAKNSTPFDSIGKEESETTSRSSRRSSKNKSNVEAERYYITGMLVNARRGRVTVNTGKTGKVKVELADDAKLMVDFTTHAAARAGDTIDVEGYYTEMGEAVGHTVKIQLAEPEKEEEKPTKKASRRSRRSSKDKDDEEAKEPSAENPGFGPLPDKKPGRER